MKRPVNRSARKHRDRSAAAAVECAICLPIIVTIVFGSIEACNMIFLKESLQTTAYEVTRAAVAVDSNQGKVASYAKDLLRQRDVNGGSTTISPSPLKKAQTGDSVVVTVTAPVANNRFSPQWFFSDGSLSVSCTMLKE